LKQSEVLTYNRVGIIGAGQMGTGIAQVNLNLFFLC
jgi:3-hydroxyacyl-CoA dehydrogenase